MTDFPFWFRPILLEGWATVSTENAALRCAFRLPVGWTQVPAHMPPNARSLDAHYGGHTVSEGLSIQLMQDASPEAPLSDWAIASLHLTGHPFALLPPDVGVNVLEFTDFGTHPQVATALNVDAVHSMGGLARILTPEPETARFYIVLARGGRIAWKFTLSIMSACLPGMPLETVNQNDHVRAGAIFGSMTLHSA